MLNTSKIVVRTPFQPFVPNRLKESFEEQLHSATFKEALFLGSPKVGTHEQLAKSKGVYYNLVRNQIGVRELKML